MNRGVNKYGLLVARGYVVTCGVYLLFSALASQAILPELYYDVGPVPPWRERAVEVLPSLGYALLLILPYRWSARGWAFRIRFTLLLLASLWLCYCAASGIYDLGQGRKHWLILPVSVLFVGLAILAPGTLVASRKGMEA